MRASVTFSERGGKAPAQGREGTTMQQPPTVPRGGEVPTQEPEDTAVQQPPAAPTTGGLDDPLLLLIGLLVIVATVGVLGWAVKRRSS
jgi:LPXTG-motif cell wall-anchored protein